MPLQAVLAIYAGAFLARAWQRIGPRARVVGIACVVLYLALPLPLTWHHLRMIGRLLVAPVS